MAVHVVPILNGSSQRNMIHDGKPRRMAINGAKAAPAVMVFIVLGLSQIYKLNR